MRVQPGAGKLSGAGLPGPNRLSTVTALGAPDAAKRSTTRRNVSSAPNGTTTWYCTKPWRPYTRFHEPRKSSGWKYDGIGMIWATRRFGALRYQSSLNALIDIELTTPDGGTTGGTLRRCAAP